MIVLSSVQMSNVKGTQLVGKGCDGTSYMKLIETSGREARMREGENLTSMLYCSYLFTSCGGSVPWLAAAGCSKGQL